MSEGFVLHISEKPVTAHVSVTYPEPPPPPPSPIPEGYTALNYIQSSGEQWLRTGITAPQSTDTVHVQMKFAFTNVTGQFVLAGCDPPYGNINSGYGLTLGCSSNDSKIFVQVATPAGRGDPEIRPGDIVPSVGTDYEIDMTTNGTSLNGSINDAIFSQTISNTPTLPFALFAQGVGDDVGTRWFAYAKVYFCKIWVNGAIVCNLLPCVRTDDGKIGMYDTVAQAFRTNGGSGADFTGG